VVTIPAAVLKTTPAITMTTTRPASAYTPPPSTSLPPTAIAPTAIATTTRPVFGGSISGHVYQADGITPIAGVWVYSYQMYNPYSGGASTAPDGSYKITGLSSGSYRIYAASRGYIMEFYNETYRAGPSTMLDVTDPNNIPDINFYLDPGGSISGHVYQVDGITPISGAKVSADILGYGFFRWVETEANGSYSIPDIPAANYRLYAEAGGYATEYYAGTYNSQQATPVTVTVSNDTSNVDFNLDRGGTISGCVFQTDGITPISGASIFACMLDNSFVRGKTSGSDGNYIITGLPSGVYKIYAEADGFAREYYENASEDTAAPLSVGFTDKIANINFNLEPGPTITSVVPTTTAPTTYPPKPTP